MAKAGVSVRRRPAAAASRTAAMKSKASAPPAKKTIVKARGSSKSAASKPPSSAAAAAAKPKHWFMVFTGANNPEYVYYMRTEWGFEKRGDRALFEKLCLEGQQAGLSWATVLAKRKAYRRAFHGFDVAKCAKMTEKDIDAIIAAAKRGPGGRDAVIMLHGKLFSIVRNARAVQSLRTAPYMDLETGKVCRTLDELLWSFVGGAPVLNNWPDFKAMPTVTPVAERMSKVLKKLGFVFVGPTICYSMMQSCGLVIDHPSGTPEHRAAAARLRARKKR